MELKSLSMTIVNLEQFERKNLRGSGVGSFLDLTGTLRKFGLSLKQLTTPRSLPTMTTLCFGLILMFVRRVRFFWETDCSQSGKFLFIERSYTYAFERFSTENYS